MLKNPVMKFLVWLFTSIFARTAEAGSNIYISAITRDAAVHGELWKEDQVYPAGPMILSQEGKKFGDKIWAEMVELLVGTDPNVNAVLEEK